MQSHQHHHHAGSSRAETFLSQLWSILHEKKWSHLVYFSKNGSAIVIPDETAFVDQVCSQRYNQSSIQAFNKQMNMWGFNRGPRSLKQLAKKGLGGDSSMYDGKNVFRLWIHPVFRRNSTEAERANISRKLDGGGAKKEKTPGGGAGGGAGKRKARRRDEYDDDEDEGDDEEDEEDEGDEDGGLDEVVAVVAGSKPIKELSLSPGMTLPPLPASPPIQHPHFPIAPYISSGTTHRSPSIPLSALPQLPGLPPLPESKSLSCSPPLLDAAMAALKRSPSAAFLPASLQQHKRQKTISTGRKTVSHGLPAEVESDEESMGSSTEESDEEGDHHLPLTQLRSPPKPYQSSPPPDDRAVKPEPASARSSTTPKPSRADDPLREVAQAVAAVVVKTVPMVSQTGRKMPVGFYFGGHPKSPDQPAGGRELQPVSQARVLLLNQTGAMTGPSSASRRTREDSKNEDLKYSWENKPTITRTDSHASSASFFVPRTSPELHQQFHDGLQMLGTRGPQDSETESWRSTQQDGEGSTISSQDESVQKFDPSVRTGQEFRCPVLPVPAHPSPRARSPALSPMGQKALLHPHPPAMPAAPHPAMRPNPTQQNSDPMLVDPATLSQTQSLVFDPTGPPSQASSCGDDTSVASSSQPLPLPPMFVVTEAGATRDAGQEMAAPPVPKPQRSASDGAAGEKKKGGKPLRRTSAEDASDSPVPPMSRGWSELFPEAMMTAAAPSFVSGVFSQ